MPGGLVLMQDFHRYRAAIEDFDAAIRAEKGNLFLYCFRGVANCEIGTSPALEAAVADVSTVIAMAPQKVKAGYLPRANGYLKEGDDQRAAADFRTCLQYPPTNAACRGGLQKAG